MQDKNASKQFVLASVLYDDTLGDERETDRAEVLQDR